MKQFYLTAVSDNVGKTTIAFGLVKVLSSYGYKVGYLKPISHNHSFNVENFAEIAGLLNIQDDIDHINPVHIDSHFTRNFLQNNLHEKVLKQIDDAYEKISSGKDIVIIEGAGHAGVGSVLGLSGAALAKRFEAPALIIGQGGIGRAVDPILLVNSYLEFNGCKTAGVLINKIQEAKYDYIKESLEIAFGKYHIDCLGYLPFISGVRNISVPEIICNAADYMEGMPEDADIISRVNWGQSLIGLYDYKKAPEFKYNLLIVLQAPQEYELLADEIEQKCCQCVIIVANSKEKRLFKAGKNYILDTTDSFKKIWTALYKHTSKLSYSQKDVETIAQSINKYVDIDRLLNNA